MTTRRPALYALFLMLFALFVPLAGCSNYDELVQKDQVAAQKWADVEGVEMHLVKGAGHVVTLDAPDAVNTLLIAFLRSVT